MGKIFFNHAHLGSILNEEHAIELDSLRAGYGDVEILHGLDLRLPKGTWTVLLGPNGSGKTTLLKTLMGQIEPSSGTARVLAEDCHQKRLPLKKIIGYLPEEMYFYPELTGEQQLRFAGDMHEIPVKTLSERVESFLSLFNLKDHRNRPIKDYSLGMKRKIGVAMALIHEPRALLLDEPMNGLDPEAAETVRGILKRYCAEKQLTILMSTHNMGMLHQYCDRLLIFFKGRILVSGTPEKVRSDYPGLTIEEIFLEIVKKAGMADAAESVEKLP